MAYTPISGNYIVKSAIKDHQFKTQKCDYCGKETEYWQKFIMNNFVGVLCEDCFAHCPPWFFSTNRNDEKYPVGPEWLLIMLKVSR